MLHEGLLSHFLIASVIEGDCENLSLHQTVSIREQCKILSLVLTICLYGKNGTNVVMLPLALSQNWELHHLEIQ